MPLAESDGTTIELSKVYRTYSRGVETVNAVAGVDLRVSGGEFVCLFGASGSGKTTLLNCIAGIDQPTSGEIEVCGLAVHSMSEDERITLRRETLGFVHQQDGLIEEFTALENTALPLEVRGWTESDAFAAAQIELERVGMGELSARLPHQLSGGQRQRVGIARALSGGRSILLADEPTGALDSVNGAVVYELLRQVAASGCIVVVASHDLRCREYATRLLEIQDGRFVNDAVGV